MTWTQRYKQAHELDFKTKYPTAYKDGHYFSPKIPDITKSNGLTQACVNFINWNGYNADRVNTTGRLINGVQKQPSGVVLGVKKFIPSANRKGTADIGATIKGRSVKIEIKVGRDKPSDEQLREQERERKAGGIYEFIHDMDEFLLLYDKTVSL